MKDLTWFTRNVILSVREFPKPAERDMAALKRVTEEQRLYDEFQAAWREKFPEELPKVPF